MKVVGLVKSHLGLKEGLVRVEVGRLVRILS